MEEEVWIHRKGAAHLASWIPLPTSRGESSFLLKGNLENQELHGWSCAHGAGRKWKRSECKSRLKEKCRVADLITTAQGNIIVSKEVELLWEEAPQAYKKGAEIVGSLEKSQVADVVAKIKPILTLKI